MKFIVRILLCFAITFTLVENPIVVAQAQAGMISTSDALATMTRTEAQTNVTNFLSRSDVKNEMIKLGVNPEDANLRLASLSDAELNSLATEISQNQAGGDFGIVGILTLVLIVILIIYFAKRI